MSPKATVHWLPAPIDRPDLLGNSIVSDNVYSNTLPNRIQTRILEDASPAQRKDIETRFWPKVNKDNDCWLWTASTTRQGCGQFTFRLDGQQFHVGAHRVSYELAYGPIPFGLCVIHCCDVPLCVNPTHLILGTQAEIRLANARRKGRLDESRPRTRKLTLADRLTIFHTPRHVTGVALAKRYGVTEACISVIRRGRFVGAPPLARSVQEVAS